MRLCEIVVCVAAIGACYCSRTACALQTEGGDVQQRVDAIKRSLAESAQSLRAYEWIETTTILLNEEEKSRTVKRGYYGADGKLQNPGFLDYRIPVCSDLPFIDTEIMEIPNPSHPYGVRGVGETSIVPPLAAVGNAVSNAIGIRMSHVPMSPPRILKAIKDAQAEEKQVSAG